MTHMRCGALSRLVTGRRSRRQVMQATAAAGMLGLPALAAAAASESFHLLLPRGRQTAFPAPGCQNGGICRASAKGSGNVTPMGQVTYTYDSVTDFRDRGPNQECVPSQGTLTLRAVNDRASGYVTGKLDGKVCYRGGNTNIDLKFTITEGSRDFRNASGTSTFTASYPSSSSEVPTFRGRGRIDLG